MHSGAWVRIRHGHHADDMPRQLMLRAAVHEACRNPAKLVALGRCIAGAMAIASTTQRARTNMPDILHKVGIGSSSFGDAYKNALWPNEIKLDNWE